MRKDLGEQGVPESVVDDAVLILSELLSNSCRYARPLRGGDDSGLVLFHWRLHDDGLLLLEVTDGGATTRPLPARPSLTARGGRGLSIVGKLACEWGVRHEPGEVTVWAALAVWGEHLSSADRPAKSA